MRDTPQYTPGDWKWFDYPDGRKLLAAPSRAVIHCPNAPIGITPADKALIGAAPDMYETLEMIRDADEDCKRDGLISTLPLAARARIDAVIAKAEGR